MGMVNKSFFTFTDWVDDYVEKITQAEIDAWHEVFLENTVCESMKDEKEQLLFAKYVKVAKLWQELKDMKAKHKTAAAWGNVFRETQNEIGAIYAEIVWRLKRKIGKKA